MDPYYAAGFVLLAGFIATLIRIEDWPPTEWSKEEIAGIVATFIGSTITAVFFAWFYAEMAGLVISSLEGMAAVVMSSVGGVASVKAAILKLGKTPEE